MLGFLKGALLVIVVLGGVIGVLYMDSKKVSEERLDALNTCTFEKAKVEADFRAYLIDGNRQKEEDIKVMDSLKRAVKETLK